MYYHIYIQYFVGDGKKQIKEDCYEKNMDSLEKIKNYYVKPFNDSKTIFTSGRVIRPNTVNIFRILKSEKSLDQLVSDKNKSVPPNVVMWYNAEYLLSGHCDDLIDITNEVMSGEL